MFYGYFKILGPIIKCMITTLKQQISKREKKKKQHKNTLGGDCFAFTQKSNYFVM